MKKLLLSKRVIYGFLFLAALFLRSYMFGSYVFGFDQVQIAREAAAISQGDFTLIGPRTGPATMFTGPLIYYIAAIFAFVMPSYWSVVATALLLTMVTGIVLLWLGKRYLSEKQTMFMIALWSFSPFIVHLDRVPWNPNITMLASALAFFPLLKQQKKLTLVDILLVSSGVFLGYQAHFSGLLLLPLVGVSLMVLFKQKGILYSVLPFFALIASVLPTVLFDIQNNWLNANGLRALVANKDRVASFGIWERLVQKMYIVIETLGKIIFDQNLTSLVLTAGLTVLCMYFYHSWKSKLNSQALIIAIWLITISVVFALYRETTPEYYFLILIPLFLYIYSFLAVELLSQKQRRYFQLGLGLYSFVLIFNTYPSDGFTLDKQLAVAHFVENTEQPVGEIVYDMKPEEAFGFQYILESRAYSVDPKGGVLHIAYPHGSDVFVTERFSNHVSVWFDTRTDSTQDYLKTEDFIISYPKNWELLEQHESQSRAEAQHVYKIFDENQNNLGSILIYNRLLQPESYVLLANTDAEVISLYNPWSLITYLDRKVALAKQRDYLFILDAPEPIVLTQKVIIQ